MNWYSHLQPKETIEKVGSMFVGKTESEIASLISSAASKGAFKQYAMIALAEEYLSRKHITSNLPTLSDQIMMGQRSKIDQYGERAFPFSEKQIAVLAHDLAYNFKFAEG